MTKKHHLAHTSRLGSKKRLRGVKCRDKLKWTTFSRKRSEKSQRKRQRRQCKGSRKAQSSNRQQAYQCRWLRTIWTSTWMTMHRSKTWMQCSISTKVKTGIMNHASRSRVRIQQQRSSQPPRMCLPVSIQNELPLWLQIFPPSQTNKAD